MRFDKRTPVTANRQAQLNEFFAQAQDYHLILQGINCMATICRLKMIASCVSMILSTLRMPEICEASPKIICEDRDFQIALPMVPGPIIRPVKVFTQLPEEESRSPKEPQAEVSGCFAQEFNRQKYLEVANTMSIQTKVTLPPLCNQALSHETHDQYIHISFEKTQNSKETKDE